MDKEQQRKKMRMKQREGGSYIRGSTVAVLALVFRHLGSGSAIDVGSVVGTCSFDAQFLQGGEDRIVSGCLESRKPSTGNSRLAMLVVNGVFKEGEEDGGVESWSKVIKGCFRIIGPMRRLDDYRLSGQGATTAEREVD